MSASRTCLNLYDQEADSAWIASSGMLGRAVKLSQSAQTAESAIEGGVRGIKTEKRARVR
jgi:hypothetical protein